MNRSRSQGLFITLEGIEGVGKSTQCDYIRRTLEEAGHEIIQTREPGGTRLGESIRSQLLDATHKDIDATVELMLIFSARAQHLQEVIRPALERGQTVICDRFTDATYAYQGGGRGIPRERIAVLEEFVQQGLHPDLTLLLDTPVATGLNRASRRSDKDRFESENAAFFERVREAYLSLAAEQPGRVRIVDADRPLEQVQSAIHGVLQEEGWC